MIQMTKQEAINILKFMRDAIERGEWICSNDNEALDMAIEALTVQQKRKPVIRCWCPKCGFEMIPTIDSEMKGEAVGGE